MLPELWSDVRYRLRTLFHRSAAERELDAELRFHIERQAEELEQRGLSRDEALRQARLAFGGVELIKEETRDARGTMLVEQLARDLRYAARSLKREPLFSITVIAMLALGIGANTATFTVVNALLLRGLPVRQPETLVTIGDPGAVGSNWVGSPQTDVASYPLYEDLRDRNHVLSGLYASGRLQADVIVRGADGRSSAVEHPSMRLVTGNFFDVLGVAARLGRTFTPDADRLAGASPVAVVSDGYWQRRLGGDPSAIGRDLVVNGVPLTIVGVTPPGFTGDVVGGAADAWVPMAMQPAIDGHDNLLVNREASWLQMMGRLRPGVTVARARSELGTIEADAIRAHVSGLDLRDFEQNLKETPIRVEAGAKGFSRFRERYASALTILMSGVALVVLIVCANVANLMLVRGIARGREMTMRMTLGAGRGRLVRQLLTESLLLAAIAAGLGVFVARIGSRLLLTLAGSGGTPVPLDVAPDGRVLLFTGGITLLATILFGLVPALRATRVEVATALRGQGRHLVGSRARLGHFAIGKALVVAQVALSAVLLVGAGLLARSLQRIVTADLGVDRHHVLIIDIPARKAGYEKARAFTLIRELADRVGGVPGVADVSYARHAMFTGGEGGTDVTVPGAGPMTDAEREVGKDDVGPNHLHALGARIVRGRDFDARDSESAPSTVIVNQTLANAYFPGVDPIGRTLVIYGKPRTIVGVVGDMQHNSVRDAPDRRIYLPILQGEAPATFRLEARVAGNPTQFVGAIRSAIADVDRRLEPDIAVLDDLVLKSVNESVLVATVTAFFGGIALLLAALGLYGVTAYATSQRTGEFGLRVALGAEPKSVSRMVLREAGILAAAGVAFGLPAGVAAARLIRGQMFGVGPLDPPSLAMAAGVLTMTALLASYIPARRAARIAPLDALRAE
jgi:predicted permease